MFYLLLARLRFLKTHTLSVSTGNMSRAERFFYILIRPLDPTKRSVTHIRFLTFQALAHPFFCRRQKKTRFKLSRSEKEFKKRLIQIAKTEYAGGSTMKWTQITIITKWRSEMSPGLKNI